MREQLVGAAADQLHTVGSNACGVHDALIKCRFDAWSHGYHNMMGRSPGAHSVQHAAEVVGYLLPARAWQQGNGAAVGHGGAMRVAVGRHLVHSGIAHI